MNETDANGQPRPTLARYAGGLWEGLKGGLKQIPAAGEANKVLDTSFFQNPGNDVVSWYQQGAVPFAHRVDELTSGGMDYEPAIRQAGTEWSQGQKQSWQETGQGLNAVLPENPAFSGRSSGRVESAMRGLAEFAPSMGAAMLNPGLGLGMTYAQIAGGQYQQLKNEGVPEERAAQAATSSALVEAPLFAASNLFNLRVLGRAFGANPLGMKIGQAVAGANSAGVVGALSTLPQDVSETWAKNPDMTLSDAVKAAGARWTDTTDAQGNVQPGLLSKMYEGYIGNALGAGLMHGAGLGAGAAWNWAHTPDAVVEGRRAAGEFADAYVGALQDTVKNGELGNLSDADLAAVYNQADQLYQGGDKRLYQPLLELNAEQLRRQNEARGFPLNELEAEQPAPTEQPPANPPAAPAGAEPPVAPAPTGAEQVAAAKAGQPVVIPSGEEAPAPAIPEDLTGLAKTDLNDLAASVGIERPTRIKRDDLVEQLLQKRQEQTQPETAFAPAPEAMETPLAEAGAAPEPIPPAAPIQRQEAQPAQETPLAEAGEQPAVENAQPQGENNAAAVRNDQGQAHATGQEPQGSGGRGGGDLQQPASGQPGGAEFGPTETAGQQIGPVTARPSPDRRIDQVSRRRWADMSDAEKQAAHFTDQLTGLGNKNAYDERVNFQPDTQVPHAAIDLDGMKFVNDTYGHPAGDTFLGEVGKVFQDMAAKHGVDAYRTGGDEITLLADQPEKLAKALDDARSWSDNNSIQIPTDKGPVTIDLSFSAGIGANRSEADGRLYEDKRQRRAAGLAAERGHEPGRRHGLDQANGGQSNGAGQSGAEEVGGNGTVAPADFESAIAHAGSDELERPGNGLPGAQGDSGPAGAAGSQRRAVGAAVAVAREGGADAARYEIREASDLIPSHDVGRNFAKNPDYPKSVQERPYHSDQGEQQKVTRNAADLDPRYLITDNPDAVNGPPVVTAAGHVLGGNSRTMSLQLAYAEHPEKAEAYRQDLKAKAASFGLDPQAVDGFKEPVLVRTLDAQPDQGGMARLSRLYNQTSMQGLDVKAEGVSRGRMVSPSTLSSLSAGLERFDTLREYMGNPASRALIDHLEADGVLERTQLARLTDARTGLLNEDGKRLVENVLRGRAVPDGDVLAAAKPAILQKIDRALPHVAVVQARGGKWDLTDVLRQAVDQLNRFQASGHDRLDTYFGQGSLVPDAAKDNPAVRAMAYALQKMGPRQFEKAWERYASYARASKPDQGVLAGVPVKGPGEAFRASFTTDGEGKPGLRFQRTWQGSPTRGIERMDDAYLGTGEGGRKETENDYSGAYGWGHYSAQKRGTAEWYRDKITKGKNVSIDGISFDFDKGGFGWSPDIGKDVVPDVYNNEVKKLAAYEVYSNRSKDDAVTSARNRYEQALSDMRLGPPDFYRDVYDLVQTRYDDFKVKKNSQLYQLEVPDPDKLLDWEKQLNEQPESVKEKLNKLGFQTEPDNLVSVVPSKKKGCFAVEQTDNKYGYKRRVFKSEKEAIDTANFINTMTIPTGEMVYEKLSRELGSAKAASQYLDSIGIPGHQYLDAGSRGAGDGSHNIVTYADKHIDITGRFRRANEDEDGRVPGFYSQMGKVLEAKLPGKGPGGQLMAMIDNMARRGDFKKEELDWSGLRDWLAEHKGEKLAKQDVLDYLRENQVELQEVMQGAPRTLDPQELAPGYRMEQLQNGRVLATDPSGMRSSFDTREDAYNYLNERYQRAQGDDTKFKQYKTPGGENYREMLLTLPAKKASGFGIFRPGGERVISPDFKTVREAAEYISWNEWPADFEVRPVIMNGEDNYSSPHWDEPNVLAHVRFDDRTGPDGEKILHIEEVQSDWHQQGRKNGYQAEMPQEEKPGWDTFPGGTTNSGPVPDAPFKTSWPMLAMKRMLRYAAENGYDKITWTTGKQQAERYDLSKKIQSLEVRPLKDGTGKFTVYANGKLLQHATRDNLSDIIGKEMAQKALGDIDAGKDADYSGLDLKVGGEGMSGFYDKILPAEVGKYVKKWGAKVGKDEIFEKPVGDADAMARERFEEDWNRPHSDLRADWTRELPDGMTEAEAKEEAWQEYQADYWDAGRQDQEDRIHDAQYNGTAHEVWSIDITPAMRESVLSEGQPLFRRGAPTDAGLDAPALREALRPAMDKLPGAGGKVDLYPTEADMPANLRQGIEEAGLSGQFRGVYDPDTGRIAFVAANIPDAKAAQRGYLDFLLRHEGRHAGFDTIFGGADARESWFEQASRSIPNPVGKWLERNGMDATPANRAEAAEEIIASWAREGTAHRLVDKVIAKMAEWVRTVFPDLKLTKAELRQMLARADDWAEGKGLSFVGAPEAATPGFGAAAPAFARDDNPFRFRRISEEERDAAADKSGVLDHVRRWAQGVDRDLDPAADPVRYGNGMLSRLEEANYDASLAGRRTIRDIRRMVGGGREAAGFGVAVTDAKDSPEARLLDKALMIYRDSKIRPEAVPEFKDWAAGVQADPKVSTQDKLAAREWLPAVERMEQLSPEEKQYADTVLDQAFKDVGYRAKMIGVISAPIENYVRRAWDIDPGKDARLPGLAGTGLKSFTTASMQRSLPTILDGIMKGYDPRIKGVSQSLEQISREIGRIEATKKTVNELKKITDEDGTPLVTTEKRDGYVKLDDPNFQVWRWSGDVKSAVSREPGMEVTNQGRKVFMTPPKDLPRGVKATDVLEKVPLYAQADVADVLNKMTAVDNFTGKVPGLRALMDANGRMKRTILTLSLFHHISESSSWMLGVNHGGEWNPITASRKGNEAIENDDPTVRLGVQHGLVLDVKQDWGEISRGRGWIERGLRAAGLGDVAETGVQLQKAGEQYLFGQFITGMKARAFQLEYAQALKAHPERTPEALAAAVARNINENFGGLNYRRMGRNPTVQNLARLFLLAPDWTESNFRNFFAMVPGDRLNKAIDRVLGGIPSPAGVPEQARGLWARVLFRTVAATAAANLLLNCWTHKDRENLVKFYKDSFTDWEQARRLNWTGVMLDPLYRMIGIDLGKEHRTLTLPVHYLDPLKLATAPDLTMKAKAAPLVRWGANFMTGTDYADRPFTGVGEFATTGKTVAANHFAPKEPFFSRLPATLVNSILGNAPVQVADLYKAGVGELDPATAVGQAAGMRLVKVTPPNWKGDYSREHQGILDDYSRAVKKGSLTDAQKAAFIGRVKDYNARVRQTIAENGLTKRQAPPLFNANWAVEAANRVARAARPPEAFKEPKLTEDAELENSLHPFYAVAQAYTLARERFDALKEAGQYDAANSLRSAVKLPLLERQVAAVREVRAEMTRVKRMQLPDEKKRQRLALLQAREARLMDRAAQVGGPLAEQVRTVIGDAATRSQPGPQPNIPAPAATIPAEDMEPSRARRTAGEIWD